ncbi:MAG: catalase family peroxidase [Hyphomicrobiaceae bacterium]|nr:catalase family peroxidase [Hyphomicrobiaceae bacterium]
MISCSARISSSALAATMVVAAALPVAPAAAQSADPAAIFEVMRTLAGKQKARPSGAKGQCFVGTFTPSAEAAKLTKSAAFTKTSRVVARFSVGGGNPKVMDANKMVNRGFSFRIDDGGPGQTEFVMVNAPINFVKSPEQMLGFLQARLPGADGKPDPAKIKAFADANPETTAQGKFLASRPVAASWVGVPYWGIHGYTLTNASGEKQLVKFRMTPVAGELGLTDDEAKAKPADFLVDELKGRLESKAPAAFDMVAIMGRPGDEKTNATQLWEDEDKRPTVILGRLAITALEKNETCDGTIFDPQTLADGVAGPADDALFLARQPAYAVSIGDRS